MRKGDLVMLNVDKCFTMKYGGKRTFPLTNHHEDSSGYVVGYRPTTDAEKESWYASDSSNGMNEAGESKLPPMSFAVKIAKSDVLIVERARCRISLGWGKPYTGMVKLMLPNGEHAYLKRDRVVVV